MVAPKTIRTGADLVAWRLALGWSVDEAAAALRVSVPAYEVWEALGDFRLPVATIGLAAELLHSAIVRAP